MKLTERQKEISRIVEAQGPITGQSIADQLHVTRAALRSDLAILTMVGILDARPKVGYYFLGHQQQNPLADKVESYIVRDHMSASVVVPDSMSVYDAAVTMFMEDIGTLLVADDGYLLGVISRKDLLRAVVGNSNSKEVPLSMIMTPVSKVIFTEGDESVLLAAQKLIDYEVDCLPVVEREMVDGRRRLRILGRLSKTNITRLFVECGQRFPVKQDF